MRGDDHAKGTATLIVTVQELDDGGFLVSRQLHTQNVSGTSSSGVTYHGMAPIYHCLAAEVRQALSIASNS